MYATTLVFLASLIGGGNNALVAGNGSRALDASPCIYTSHLADTPKADDLHELHNILDFVGAECCRVSRKGIAVI
jgi:hypothetical protein